MSSIQSILGLLRHHQAMSFREEALKKEAAEWNRAIEISTSTAAEKAKLHDKIVKELKNSVLEAVAKKPRRTQLGLTRLSGLSRLIRSLLRWPVWVCPMPNRPSRFLKEINPPFKIQRTIFS